MSEAQHQANRSDEFENQDAIAVWESAFLPGWKWEAYEEIDTGYYFGRVKSPNTCGQWEAGYFTRSQLRDAGAYRTDTEQG